MVMFCRSEGSTRSKYLRGLPARRLSSSVLSNGQVHDMSARLSRTRRTIRTDVLTGYGSEAINLNTAIEDHDGS